MFKQPKGESFWVCYKQFLEEKKNYNRGYTKTLISLNNTLEKFEKEGEKNGMCDEVYRIHHHFEQLGWSEPTVVIRFWIVAFVLALAGLSTLKLR